MTAEQIKQRLEAKLPGAIVEVTDLTGTQDHYQVEIISKAFVGQTRVQQQRTVMAIFDDELKSGEIHALAMKTKIPN